MAATDKEDVEKQVSEETAAKQEEEPKINKAQFLFIALLFVAMVVGIVAGIVQDNDDDTEESPAATVSDPEPALSLTIFHMNDHHSQVQGDDSDFEVADLPEGFPGNLTGVEEIEYLYGGFPRIASLIKSMSADAAEAGTEVLKLHAGDALVGSILYSLFEGDSDADMMNEICFDAFALGNHEFDDGDTTLATFIETLQASDSCTATPVLSANLSPNEASPLRRLQEDGALVSNIIKEFSNGAKVGIIGINIANKTMLSSQPDEGTILLDEREIATQQVAELTEAGVNKIIVVSHIGYDKDLEWMAAIEGVDVVVGGDSHTLLGEEGEFGFAAGEYPTTIETESGNKVCVVQAWEYSKGVGKLDIEFDSDGNVVSCMGDFLIPFDAVNFDPPMDEVEAAFIADYLTSTYSNLVAVSPDASTVTALDTYVDEVDELTKTPIATVPSDICFERIPGQGRSTVCPPEASSTQGGGACNVVAKAFLVESPTADVAIQNGGGCRTDIFQGDFTIESAYTLLPFANTLVTLDMTGSEIVTVLEQGATNAFGPADGESFPYGGSTGAYPYASGLRYTVTAGAAAGEVVTEVEINSRLEGAWAPMDLDATYRVVTNSFIAGGRDGYVLFGEIDEGLIIDTYEPYAQAFIDYAKDVTELVDLPSEEYSTKSFSTV